MFQGDDGPSLSLSAAESALLDEISIKPASKTVPIVRPKPARPKPAFDPGLDNFINTSKRLDEDRHIQFAQQQQQAGGLDDGDEEQQFMEDGDEQQQRMHEQTPPSEGYKSIEDEKADLLNKIARLQKKGFSPGRKFTIHSDIEELRTEYKRIVYGIEADQSIKFQRRMMIACVSGIEFLNKKFDPFDLELDGWSENMMENQEDYDTVFEELFQKYRSKVSVAPEIKLMFMVGGSAMMFHLSKSMFKPFQQQQQQQQQTAPQQQTPAGARRDMRGPGIDLTSLGKGFDISNILGTLNQVQQQRPQDSEDEVSDIISISSEIKDLEIPASGFQEKRRKRSRSSKKELVL